MYREENKRQDVISVKLDHETKVKLEQFARDKEWSISYTACKIIRNYFLTENKG